MPNPDVVFFAREYYIPPQKAVPGDPFPPRSAKPAVVVFKESLVDDGVTFPGDAYIRLPNGGREVMFYNTESNHRKFVAILDKVYGDEWKVVER